MDLDLRRGQKLLGSSRPSVHTLRPGPACVHALALEGAKPEDAGGWGGPVTP